MSDVHVVEAERRAEDVKWSYKMWMRQLKDDYRLVVQLVK